jgi:hypothetical protein
MQVGLARKLTTVIIACSLAAFVSCKKEEEEDDEEVEETGNGGNGGGGAGGGSGGSSALPQVGAINLGMLGTGEAAGLRLQDGPPGGASECSQGSLGLFGLALGAACHTAPLAANLLIGNGSGDHDGDGDMDCDDLAAAKASGGNAGMLLHLMCEQVMLDNSNVTSLAGQDDESGVFAISFADFANDTTAVGSWTQGNAASYPADIRAWNGAGFDSLKGIFSLGMTDINNGHLHLDMQDPETSLAASVQFSNKGDAAACASGPSSETCNWQDIKLYSGEDETMGAPNGFHLKIFADSKEAPTFLGLEGRYRYTEAGAAAAFGSSAGDGACGDEVATIRSIYFTAVQKGGQVWGKFFLRDENGDVIECMAAGIDIFGSLADGICQNVGEAGEADCTEIDESDYAGLWEGEADFDNITASPVPDVWGTDAPTGAGLCTTSGCQAF